MVFEVCCSVYPKENYFVDFIEYILMVSISLYFATVTIHLHASSVTVFNGTNFSEWHEQVDFHLDSMDINLALLENKPATLTDSSSEAEKLHFKAWERSNRLCLKFLRMTIANNIKSTIPQTESAKEFLKFVEERFRSAEKCLAGILMAKLTTMKYDGSKGMQDHIIEMTNIAARLKSLGLAVEDSFLVQFMLNSLPPEYGPFQINYNTIKDKWDVNELAGRLVQEEMRLKSQGNLTVNLVGQGAGKKMKVKANKFKKNKRPANASQAEEKERKNDKCHFCKKEGHYQKDCLRRKAWFEKRGIFHYVSVFFESNLAEVPNNTWWLDSGATTHVSNMMQRFITIRTTNPASDFLFMGNRMKAPIEGIGTYRLVLDSGYQLDLSETIYVPSISRNLISVSKLDVCGFDVKFGSNSFSLFKNSGVIGSGFLIDGLYKLKLDNIFVESLLTVNDNIGLKRSMMNENSAYLWHKRLGHISKERLQRLVNNEILPNLDFTDLRICVDCIKGKQTKHSKKGATRSTQLLEIIHTDICGPFDTPTINGEKYFITFIDDFSRYGYIYLLHEKSQSVNALVAYIREVERQLDKKVKIVRSDRGGEFYGKYDESG